MTNQRPPSATSMQLDNLGSYGVSTTKLASRSGDTFGGVRMIWAYLKGMVTGDTDGKDDTGSNANNSSITRPKRSQGAYQGDGSDGSDDTQKAGNGHIKKGRSKSQSNTKVKISEEKKGTIKVRRSRSMGDSDDITDNPNMVDAPISITDDTQQAESIEAARDGGSTGRISDQESMGGNTGDDMIEDPPNNSQSSTDTDDTHDEEDQGRPIKMEDGIKDARRRRTQSDGDIREIPKRIFGPIPTTEKTSTMIYDKCIQLENRFSKNDSWMRRDINKKIPEGFADNTKKALKQINKQLKEIQKRQDDMGDWMHGQISDIFTMIGVQETATDDIRVASEIGSVIQDDNNHGSFQLDNRDDIGPEQQEEDRIEHIGATRMATESDAVGNYYGRSDEDLDQFLYIFEMLCDDRGYEDDKKKATQLIFRLRGPALQVVMRMSEDTKKNYREITKKLKETYIRPDQQRTRRLSTRRWNTGMIPLVLDFEAKLMPLLEKAHPNESREQLDNRAYEIIMDKLTPQMLLNDGPKEGADDGRPEKRSTTSGDEHTGI